MLRLLLAALLSCPVRAEGTELFLHVERADASGQKVLSVRWEEMEGGLLEDAIAPLIKPLRPELDRAALRLDSAAVGQSAVFTWAQGETNLVARLEQRPDPTVLFAELVEELAVEVAEASRSRAAAAF